MSINEKQKRFCEEYLIDLNATQAAIRAGYSEKTANEQGARLLANASIQEHISELMKVRSERTLVTADRVIKELAAVAFANIDDFARVEQVTYTDTSIDEEGNPIYTVRTRKDVNVFETELVDRDKIPAIASIKQTKEGIELKTHDKIKSLELLGKHLGMFITRIDATTKGGSLNNDKRPVMTLPDGTTLEL